jgi:hypothetical protein
MVVMRHAQSVCCDSEGSLVLIDSDFRDCLVSWAFVGSTHFIDVGMCRTTREQR